MKELDKIKGYEEKKQLFEEVVSNETVSLTWTMKNILGLSESEIKEEIKKKK